MAKCNDCELCTQGVLAMLHKATEGGPSNLSMLPEAVAAPFKKKCVRCFHPQAEHQAFKVQISVLLFPSTTGGYQSPSCLAKPIQRIADAAKIKKQLSPYFMRRTFQDLCRAAQVHDFVARAISGHATVEMQAHYSSVAGSEVRANLAKVIDLAGFRKVATPPAQSGDSGDGSGDALAETKAAG